MLSTGTRSALDDFAYIYVEDPKMLILLEKALELSEKISEQMDTDNWDSVELLQQEREQLLNKLSQTELPTNPSELETVNRLSDALQIMTKQHMHSSSIKKQLLLDQIKGSNKSKKMRAAYSAK
jgi:hypothetical protein